MLENGMVVNQYYPNTIISLINGEKITAKWKKLNKKLLKENNLSSFIRNKYDFKEYEFEETY